MVEAARLLKEKTSLVWVSENFSRTVGEFQSPDGSVLDIIYLKKLLSSDICNTIWGLGAATPKDDGMRRHYAIFAKDLKNAKFKDDVINYCKTAYNAIDPL